MEKATRKSMLGWIAPLVAAALLLTLSGAAYALDVVPPTFTSAPTANPGSWTNSGSVVINWAATDDTTPPEGFEYRIDSSDELDFTPDVGSSLTLDPAQLGLPDGEHTVDIRIADAAGNSTIGSVRIYVDHAVPDPFVVTALPASWTKGPIAISFDTTDPGAGDAPQTGSGIDYYSVSVDGVDDYGDQISPFALDTSAYASGTYTVRVTAHDIAGNTRSSETIVQVDNDPPAPFDATADTADWSRNDVGVSFLTSDPLPGSGLIDRYEVSIDGGPYAVHSSPCVVSDEGAHLVMVRALDAASPEPNVRYCNAPVSTLIDRTPPQLDGFFNWGDSGAQIPIDYTASDALSGISSVSLWYRKGADGTWTASGLSQASTSGTFFFDSLGDATYYFGFVIEDNAGNILSSASGDGVCSTTVDTELPVFDAVAATPHYARAGTTVTITFTVSEALLADPYVGVGLDDATLVGASGLDYTFEYTVSPTAEEGPADIYIEGIDSMFNYNWIDNYDQLTIDNTPPDDFTPAVSPGQTNASSVVVTFEAADAISGIDFYEISVDDGPYSLEVSPFALDTSSLSEGAHTIRVKAVDLAGNERIKDATVIIDRTAPAGFAPVADPAGWTNADSVTLTFGTSDSGSGVARYEVAVDGGGYSVRSSPYVLDVTAIADGTHTVHIKAIDNAGNEQVADVSISLDKQAPVTSVPALTPADWTDATTAEIVWSATDTGSGVDHCEVALDDGAYTVQTSPYTLSLTGLAGGAHVVRVKAIDLAGNATVVSATAHVTDTSAPSAALTFTDPKPSLGRQFDYVFWKNWMGVKKSTQNSYNVNWTASGNGKPLARVLIEYRAGDTATWRLLKSTTSAKGTARFDVSRLPESDSYQFRITATDRDKVSTTVVYDRFGVYDATRLKPTTEIVTPQSGATLCVGECFSGEVRVTLPVFTDPRAEGQAYKSDAPDWWFAGHKLAVGPAVRYYKKKSSGVPQKLLGTLSASVQRETPVSIPAVGSGNGAFLDHVVVNIWQAEYTEQEGMPDCNHVCQLEMKYSDVVTIGNTRQPDKPNKPGEKLPRSVVEPLINTLKRCEYVRFFIE